MCPAGCQAACPAVPGVKSQIEDKWPRLNFQMDHFFVHYDPVSPFPILLQRAVVMVAARIIL